MRLPFVGRGAELSLMHTAWRGAQGGEACVIVLAAHSGSGKTTLMAQFLDEARPGRAVWVSGGEPLDGELPWQLLGQLCAGLSGRTERVTAWTGRDPLGSPVHAGLSLLDDLKAAAPAVLIVDDVQWADRQSQAVLRFAARHLRGLPVLMVVACNDEHAAVSDWQRIFPPTPGRLMPLAGLSAQELVELATRMGRTGLSPAGAARLHEHTGGNPLFAVDVLGQVLVRDTNTGHGPLPAPRSIADSVAAKLASRTGPAQSLATAAAVLGTEFDVALARALAGVADAPSCLDDLTAAGLIAEIPATAGHRFRFSHALVRQAVYECISHARRRELHRKAAGIVDESAALRHRVAAVEGTDPRLAADLDRQAEREAGRGELTAAVGHRREALTCSPGGPARTRRLLTLVETELIAGDATTARAHAAEIAAGGGDPWWDYVAGYQAMLAGDFHEARRRLTGALDAAGVQTVPGAPADLAARIATNLAVMGLVSLSYPDMVKYGQVAITAGSADTQVRAFAWLARTLGLTLTGHGGRALAELADHAHGHGRDLDLLAARGIAELWTDDLGAALAHLAEAVRRAYLGEPLRAAQALAFLGEAEYRRGLLDASAQHTEHAVWEAEENERIWDYALLHGLACQTRAARGDWAEAEAHARAGEEAAELWAAWTGTGAVRLSAAGARAVIAQARGDIPGLLAAAVVVEAVLDSPEPGITLLGPLRAEALVQLGNAAAAEAALAEYTERFCGSGRDSALMSTARVRGRIAVAGGDYPAALAAYTSALEKADSVGLPLEAARIEMLMGDCLAVSGRRLGAGMRLRAALRCFTRIGAHAYAAQAEALIRGHGLPFDELDDPADPLADLTLAQRPVIALVKDGLPSLEIGKRVCVSASGVEQHLTRIYQELGLTGSKRAGLRRLLNGLG